MNLERNLTLYRIDQITQTPKATGIYAWFPKMTFGAMDHSGSTQLIDEWSTRLATPKIELVSNRVFGRVWKASVEIEPELNTNIETSSDEWTLFRDHFNSCFTQLTGPIYVGKANNLRSRLTQHIRCIENLSQNIELLTGIDKGDAENFEDVRNFAERVISQRKFSMDNLLFTFLEFPKTKSISEDQKSKINSDVESVLNKIIRPIFGNR